MSVFLLQNATLWLENATVIIKCDDFITKRVGTYIVGNSK